MTATSDPHQPALATEETTVLRRPGQSPVTPPMPAPMNPAAQPDGAAAPPVEETAVLPAVERPSTWKPAAPATPRGTPPAAAPVAPEVAPAPVEAPAVVMPANQTGLDELMEPDVAPVPTQPARARLDGFKEWCGQGDNGLILGAVLVGLLLLLVVFAA